MSKCLHCNKQSSAKNLCKTHYTRFKRHGNALITKTKKRVGKCSFCDRTDIEAKNMCFLHYDRWLKHGNPLITKRRANGEGTLHPTGYYYIRIKGKQIRRCRIILEKKLGRKLFHNEICHHIDFNKQNDSPENLEALTRKEHAKKHEHQYGNKKKRKTTGKISSNSLPN